MPPPAIVPLLAQAMPRRPARGTHARLAAVVVAVAALLAPLSARAEPAEPAATSAAAPTGNDTTAPVVPHIGYSVVIVAPAPLDVTLARVVGLVRWRDYAEMTEDLLDRLAREAFEETRYAAAAEGFFEARIEITVDRNVAPYVVTLTVVPGEPVRIDRVDLAVTGPAATDPDHGARAIARMRDEWRLPRGDVFRQTAWDAAKAGALAAVTSDAYAAAKIATSEALIDPPARTADLTLGIESGPLFRFGSLDIRGLSRYTPELVRNFNTIRPGDVYSQKELDRLVRRLNASGYFASAHASIEPDTDHPDDATVDVAVIEAPPRRFEGGLGYSTDVDFRANASYRDVNIDGKGLQLLAEGRLESKVQSLSVRFTAPPNASGWLATYGAGAERTDIEGLVTQTAAIGTRWRTIEERGERAVSATYYFDEQQTTGAEKTESHAFYPEVEWISRNVDDLIAPTRGWNLSLQGGGGIPGLSSKGFGRVIGRFAAWYPVSRTDQLQFRSEAGAVLADSRDGIPSALLFRTGGDTTVRGYAFESLGVKQGDAVVGGRYYAIASGEAIHWMSDAWGLGVFVDAGNAADSISGFRFDLGYGAGLRVRTPLGPFRLDLAYGQAVQQVRVHFSVGLTF